MSIQKKIPNARTVPRARHRLGTATALSLIALTAAGCTAGIKGRSDPPHRIALQDFNRSEYAQQIDQALRDAATAEAYYCVAKPWACGEDVLGRRPALATDTVKPTVAELVELRNAYVNNMTLAHKLALEDYARALTVEGGTTSFLAHLTQLGLNTAAVISKVPETSRVLSALAVGVLGIDEGYSKKVLLGNTIPVLLDKMRAAQITEITKILSRLTQSVETYPLSAARADVVNLSAVVNIETAIQAIAEEARNARKQAEKEEDKVRTIEFCKSAYTDRIRDWFNTDDLEVQSSRFAAAQSFLNEQGITGSVAGFYADCNLAKKHAVMVDKLGIE